MTKDSGITLSEQNRLDLLRLGALRWPEAKIAAFFGWDKRSLKEELANPESEVSRLLLRGELEEQFKLESKLMDDAAKGNIAAASQFQELVRARDFKLSKTDLFGGSEDPGLFDRILKYISHGSSGDMSAREQLYLDGLQLIYSLNIKFGDRKTVRLLTREPYNLSYERARDLIGEAIELFNGGRRNSKEAMRHHTAECYDTLYHAIIASAKSPQDYALAAGILDKKVKLLQLNEPDVTQLPPQQYNRQWRLLSLDPGDLGLPPANRDEMGQQIDALKQPDPETRRLKMEAGIIQTDITEMMHNVVPEES